MAEQTNFYAVQRGAPWSFRPVSDGVINWYLYNFGSNLGVAFVERPSNLWVEMPWNCIFRVKNIVFSSASGGLRPPDPPLWAPYIFTSGFFFFPCAHPCGLYFRWATWGSSGSRMGRRSPPMTSGWPQTFKTVPWPSVEQSPGTLARTPA